MSHSVANREQAKLCIEKARTEMKRLRYTKAIKFLEKARRMNPDDDVAKELLKEATQKLLASINSNSNKTSQESSNGASSKKTESKVEPPKMKRRKSSKNGTKEECERINNCKDYYKILGVPRNADSKSIRMAYRKLARRFHPDKNNNEKEYTEAFKAIGQAYDTLSDDDKRSHYDRFGSDDPSSNPRAQYARRYQHDFRTADDIFDTFFGGQHPIFATRGFQRRRAAQGQNNVGGPLAQFAHILPLIMIMLVSFLNFQDGGMGNVRRETFRFTPSVEYSSKRMTANRNINFYVPEEINRDLTRNRYYKAQVEAKVESKYYKELDHRCKSEKRNKRRRIRDLIREKNDDDKAKRLLEKARKQKLQNCDELHKLFPELYRGRY